MKIGLFTPNFPGLSGDGGIGSYTKNFSRELLAQGHVPHVLTYGNGESRDIDGVRVHFVANAYLPVLDRLFPGLWRAWVVGSAMRKLVEHERLDVVEFPNWEGVGLFFFLLSDVPSVVRLHTSTQESQKIEGFARSRAYLMDIRLERWSVKCADSIVTHSEAHRKHMAAELGIPKNTITVIRHGIALAPSYQQETRLVDTLLFVGRMEARKGVVDLISAFEILHAQLPSVKLVLIGRDRMIEQYGFDHQEYARQNVSATAFLKMNFLGVLSAEEVLNWMAKYSVFVAPSRYESFGLVFLEAMRFGTPVIGTKAGGIPEVVEDGVAGLLAEPANPESLAAEMIRLLSDAELRKSISESALRVSRERFDISVVTRDVLSYYT